MHYLTARARSLDKDRYNEDFSVAASSPLLKPHVLAELNIIKPFHEVPESISQHGDLSLWTTSTW